MEQREYKKVQNGPKNSIPKDFIPNGIDPLNNKFFDAEFNPLSTKGNSVVAEDYGTFQKGGPSLNKLP